MTKQTVFSFSLVLIFLFHCTKTIAQTPDILKILDKPGEFTVFIRLLKSTGMSDQINGEVQKSTSGYTVFAPNDKAFSDLRSGTINSLTDLQKVQLIQFHILATGVTLSNFQTLSNPVPTQAGGIGTGEFPLNVTSSGKQVQLATGVVKATLGKTLYSDDNLIVYQVDNVLLPMDLFGSASVLTPPKPEKSDTDTPAPTAQTSGATSPTRQAVAPIVFGVGFGAIFSLWL